MIKNLLYSLFLHLALIAIIYANFNVKVHQEDKSAEIVISMQMLTEKKPVVKKEVKEKPKKIEKKKPEKKPKKKPKKKAKKKLKRKTPTKKKKTVKKVKKEIKETAKEVKKEPPKPEEKIEDLKNSIDNLDLSAREKFNIRNQLRRCYNNAIKESNLKSTAQIIIRASIDENGFISSNIDELMKDEKHLNDPASKIALNHAKRAVELCNPLRNLPLDKYEIWKDVSVQFNETDSADTKSPKEIDEKSKKEETVK